MKNTITQFDWDKFSGDYIMSDGRLKQYQDTAFSIEELIIEWLKSDNENTIYLSFAIASMLANHQNAKIDEIFSQYFYPNHMDLTIEKVENMINDIKIAIGNQISESNQEEFKNWISVNERLPENDTKVMVWLTHKDNPTWDCESLGAYLNNKFYLKNGYNTHFEKITHWMPLPKKPNK